MNEYTVYIAYYYDGDGEMNAGNFVYRHKKDAKLTPEQVFRKFAKWSGWHVSGMEGVYPVAEGSHTLVDCTGEEYTLTVKLK